MADDDTKAAETREFPIEVTVGKTKVTVTLTLKSTAAVAPTAELLEADRAWVRSFWTDLVPHAGGVASYVNFMSEFEEDRIVASYGAEKSQRLSQIKAEYAPTNLFHLNANIRPATA